MHSDPAESQQSSNDRAERKDVKRTEVVRDERREDAPKDASRGENGQHVESQRAVQPSFLAAEFRDVEEGDVEPDEAYKGREAEEAEGEFAEAGEIYYALPRLRLCA